MSQAVREKPVLISDVLELAEELPIEQQEMVVKIMGSRLRDQRRAQIIADAQEAREAYRRGDVTRGTVDELMAEIDRELMAETERCEPS